MDAAAFLGQFADPPLEDALGRQAARMDLLAPNKLDLAGAAGRAAVAARVAVLAPGARQTEVRDGALPEALMGSSVAFGPDTDDRVAANAPGHPFRAWCWRGARPFDPARCAPRAFA